MAKRTDFQKQADRRIKNASSLRTRADSKVRRYAALLGQALVVSADATARIARINTLYGTSYSTETTLVDDLNTAGVSAALAAAAGGSVAGAPVLAVAAAADANGGAVLAGEAVFGEALTAAGTPSTTPTTPSGPIYDTSLAGPSGSGANTTLAASAGDALAFNALTSGTSAPYSMDINIGGTQVASVTTYDRYAGKAFRFTHAGVAHTGSFAATVNF